MRIQDLDTPVVTIHLDVMEDNIRRVQAHLDRHGIGNRPHIKTHKIPAIGRLQLEGGATRYDGKAFTHFTQEEGLPSTNVYCMLEDRDGRIWFGSVGYGASRYDGKTFTNFSTASLPK